MELVPNNALTEVYEVLKHLSKIEFSKIPKETLDIIKKNKNDKYKWEYNDSKSLLEQNLSREAIAILSYINLKYLLNDEKRRIMEEIYAMNERKIEEKKRQNFNAENLFNKKPKTEDKNINQQEVYLIERKEGLFKKIINKIKMFLL